MPFNSMNQTTFGNLSIGRLFPWNAFPDFGDEYERIYERYDYRSRDTASDIVTLCEDHLARLNKGDFGNPKRPRQLAFASSLRVMIANIRLDMRQNDGVLAMYETALDEAYESGYHDVIYSCLHRLGGYFEIHQDDLQKALDYYQRSLPFSCRRDWPHNYAQTLHNLAMVWERLGEPDKALAMYDLWITVGVAWRWPREYRFQCLIRNGRMAEVEAAANQMELQGFGEILNCYVARKLLDRSGEADDTAKLGLERATKDKNRYWTKAFADLFETDTDSIATARRSSRG